MIYGKDKIQVQHTTAATRDEQGDFHAGSTDWGVVVQCDAEPAKGEANVITLNDGTTERYTYIVYLPVDFEAVAVGTHVKLTRQDGTVLELQAKGFHRYTFQCKLWL